MRASRQTDGWTVIYRCSISLNAYKSQSSHVFSPVYSSSTNSDRLFVHPKENNTHKHTQMKLISLRLVRIQIDNFLVSYIFFSLHDVLDVLDVGSVSEFAQARALACKSKSVGNSADVTYLKLNISYTPIPKLIADMKIVQKVNSCCKFLTQRI